MGTRWREVGLGLVGALALMMLIAQIVSGGFISPSSDFTQTERR